MIDRFDFDNDAIFDQKIQTVPAIELYVAVNDRHWLLLFHFQAPLPQLESQTGFVGRLE